MVSVGLLLAMRRSNAAAELGADSAQPIAALSQRLQ